MRRVNHLAVLARAPREGAVKTRLGPSLPAPLAKRLHIGLLADAVEVAAAWGDGQVTIFWEGEPEGADGPTLGSEIAERRQRGADLGERLAAAFSDLLSTSVDRVVAIGSDCPDLDTDRIRAAFTALDHHDLVLGPARDGGYYLIGLARLVPELFRRVSWGTDQVLAQTLARARSAGLEACLLAPLEDLDTPADLVRFIARRAVSSPGPGRHTETALRVMGLLPPAPHS